jgi:hypothetical protein
VHFTFHDWKGLLRISFTIEVLLTTTRRTLAGCCDYISLVTRWLS